MPSARFLVRLVSGLAALALPLLLGSGCAQSNPLISHRSTLGSLKTSVSQLEFENRQLAQKVATLQAENRQIEDRLVQEEALNGDLSARLDDAKALLSRRNLGSGSESAELASPEVDPFPPRKTLPAGRSTRKTRKPPFAQIPGRIDPVPPARDEDDPADPSGSGWKGEFDPQTRRDDPTVWLPVARAASPPAPSRR